MDGRMREAAQTGSIDVLYQLIKEDRCVLERIDSIPFLDTPLHVAASAGRIDFMMEMINLKPSFAIRLNQDGSSPMHLALKNDRTQAVLRLFKFDKGLVRVKGREGLTPLHHAVQTGQVDLLIKFLEACPEAIEDVTVRDETVFHLAAKNDMSDAFEVLVGWLIRSQHEAAQRWEKELLSWADIEGNTVLHIAVVRNRSQMVKLLLEHMCGDHINAKNLEGLTALDINLNCPLVERQPVEDMLRKARGLSGSLVPNKSISSVDIKSLRKRVTCFQKLETIACRGKKSIPNEMRNTFLVVTVLIITAAYQASLNPPKLVGKSPSKPGLSEAPTQTDDESKAGEIFDDWVKMSPLSVPSEAPALTPEPFSEIFIFYGYFESVIVSTTFWLYNSLTFWAAIWLTAYLLPSNSTCLFLHVTLSLFGNCYVLLVCVFTRTKAHHEVAAFPPKIAHGLSILNYSFSTILSLLVLFRIARYIRRRFVLKTKIFIVAQIFSICFFAFILVPAVLFSETILNLFEPDNDLP